MQLRFVGVGVLLLALVACGGGGGGPGPVPATPTPKPPASPTPTPTPTPTPPPARPASNGDSFAYAGTLVRGFVRNAEPGLPLPTPVQTNAQTFTSAVTQKVAVTTGASFGGATNLTDFKTVETDAQVSPAKTTIVTSDAYSNYPVGGSGNVRAVATVATTSDGAKFVTAFGTGNGLVDVLPEVTGPIGPPNNASLVTSELDPDGTTTTRTTNPDGSYSESSKYPDGTSALATEAADGTGTYSLPLFGFGTSPSMPTTPNTVLTVGAIVPAAAPLPAYIPITIVYSPALLAPATPPPTMRKVGDWYPGTPPQPPVLASETYVDTGSQPIPAACNVSAALATSGNALVQTISKTDTIFGEIESLTTTSYVAAAGVVCTQLVDSVTQYYDYSGQTFRTLATFSTPLQITTVTETLGLTAETLLGTVRRTDEARSVTGGAMVATAGLLQNFTASVERRRLERHAAARRAFRLTGAR